MMDGIGLAWLSRKEHVDSFNNLFDGNVSLRPITTSMEDLKSAARVAEEEAKKLREQVTKDDLVQLKRRSFNHCVMLTERGFLEAEGLQGRKRFKHLVYGPPSENNLPFFPGVADAISRAKKMPVSEGYSAVQHEIWRAAGAIQRAAAALKGELA